MFRKAFESHKYWLEKRKFSRWEAMQWIFQAAPWGDSYVAVYQDHSEPVPRGHVLVSTRLCGKHWGWSNARVWRFLNELESDTTLKTVKETPIGTLYLIVNYELYQGYETASETPYETAPETATKQQRNENNTENTTPPLAGRFCAAVNRGLSEHITASKRQIIARITPQLDSTRQAIEAMVQAGVPDEFAERELFEAGRTHNSETPVTSLKYFAPRIIRLWQQHQAGQDATNAKIPASDAKAKQADAQRIWNGMKRTKVLYALNADEWLAAATQMHIADEIESVDWFRSLMRKVDKNALLTARSDHFAVQHIASVMPANLKIA